MALGSKAQSANQLRYILRKNKISGVDVKAIAQELVANPQPVPRRVFVDDEMALVPLYSWTYGEDGSVESWDHVLLKK